jgi:hypothetical protein
MREGEALLTGADTWNLDHVNHINAITDGYQDTLEHFRDRVGFTLNREIPDSGDGTDACLMTLGGMMFEFFCPKDKTAERGQGRLLRNFGDHYVGIEYGVPDVAEARQVCEARGVRIINDRGAVFFTYPGSTFGISFEIWSGDFKQHAQPETYWRDEHPLALTGLERLTVAVESVDAAVERMKTLAGVPKIGDVERSHAKARGAQLKVGDIVWELLEPTGDGPLASFLERYGPRIRSSVFRTADLSKAEKHLNDQGFDVIPGDADGAIAIDPAQNKNLFLEFTE